jgi:hypothetical protein
LLISPLPYAAQSWLSTGVLVCHSHLKCVIDSYECHASA